MENNLFILGPIFLPLIGSFASLRFARHNRFQRFLAVFIMILAWFSSVVVLYQNWDTGQIQVYRLGGWQPPYGIVLVADMLSATFQVMVTTILFAGMLYTLHGRDKSMNYPAFIPSFLAMSAGLCGAFYTGDIFTMFVFVELMVITSVVLVAVSDNPFGLEAAMKYVLISGLGSLFLLIGIGSIYMTTGSLNMAAIAAQLQAGSDQALLARAAATMLVAAFLLKSAVFPFHFWQPDFHTTAPTPVGAMLSSVVVKVGVYGVIRIVTLLFVEQANVIGSILLILGLIGIYFGSLSALRTYHAKRMLAYSTFGQIGFILVGIGWNTRIALIGAIIYAINHAFIKSSLLMLTGIVSSHTKTKSGTFSELAGAGKQLVFTSILYFLGGLALAGVPPMNGFISKLALVHGGIDAKSWVPLVLAVGAGSLTLLYITRAWSLMFQRIPDDSTVALRQRGEGDSVLAPALLIMICVGLGFYAEPLVNLVNGAVDQILQPEIYINAVLGR